MHPQEEKAADHWVQLSVEFVAKGFERYFFIGNMKMNSDTKIKEVRETKVNKGSYYYVDDVSLVRTHSARGRIQVRFYLRFR